MRRGHGGDLVKRAGRVLGAGVVVLAAAGVLLLAGSGIANAQPASSTACQKIQATLASALTTLSTDSTGSEAKKVIANLDSQLTQAASTGSSTVKSAVSTFVTDLNAGAAASNLDVAKMTADGNAIVAACAATSVPATGGGRAPSGAPATGGGSAAAIQDPGLFGVGGAAVLAGLVILGLALRNRLRTAAGQN
jgi:hypothetical protein